jgi:hypothetical protein
MIEASDKRDSVTFYQQFGYLLQIMYDFSSYKVVASSLFTYIMDAGKQHNELKGIPPTHLRAANRHEAKLAAREKRLSEGHKLETGEGYDWTIFGFV